VILHDRVTLTTTQTTGEDAYGNPITTTVTSDPIPAEVRPVNSDELLNVNSDQVRTTYRLVVRPGTVIGPADRITWRGVTYDVTGNLEKHTIGGRVHHQEALIRSYSG